MAITPALIVHVSAGSIGILSGAVALSVSKGGRLHRAAGNVFFVSMLTMATMATCLAALIPQRNNVVGGVFVFYLVGTAWMTVRRREGSAGLFEYSAILVALAVVVADLIFGLQATHSPKGKLDGFPAAIYFGTACIAAIGAAGDLGMILRGGISGARRIARHLWRMCLALFFAAGSFFIGQQKVMPAFMHGSPILLALGISPLFVMVFWLIRVRLTKWSKPNAVAA